MTRKRTTTKPTVVRPTELTGDVFDALPAAEKERIFQGIERQTPAQRLAESRPLNRRERAIRRSIKRKAGRPRIGKGTTNISVSLEKGLLKRADAYARRRGMSRSELIARGVEVLLGSAA